MVFTVGSRCSILRLQIATSAPARASSIAIDRPMPRPPPVTIAVLPRSENGESAMAGTILHGTGDVERAARSSPAPRLLPSADSATSPTTKPSYIHRRQLRGVRPQAISAAISAMRVLAAASPAACRFVWEYL